VAKVTGIFLGTYGAMGIIQCLMVRGGSSISGWCYQIYYFLLVWSMRSAGYCRNTFFVLKYDFFVLTNSIMDYHYSVQMYIISGVAHKISNIYQS
jgi:hypothetical protein